MATPEPLVRIVRGDLPESTHHGALAVVEAGRTILARGDLAKPVFYRSSSKPLQALEVVRCGAADAFRLAPDEIAIAAGSHSAEPRHLAAVRSMLSKSGVPESALRCGGHRSIDADIAFAQRRDGVPVTSILSNCSGKHSAMLVAAKHRGDPLDGYLDPSHPVQVAIRAHVAAFAGLDVKDVLYGVDGCGAPAFAVPLDAMARSIANLGAPQGVPPPLATAARRVADAMRAHPEMVAGEGRFDTDLMRASKGRCLAKAGAEGVHVVAVPERRLGIAVKVEDGSDRGYRVVVVEALRRLGVLSDADANAVREKHAAETIKNMAGHAVGRMLLAFDLAL
jgi:L-asparaginase II